MKNKIKINVFVAMLLCILLLGSGYAAGAVCENQGRVQGYIETELAPTATTTVTVVSLPAQTPYIIYVNCGCVPTGEGGVPFYIPVTAYTSTPEPDVPLATPTLTETYTPMPPTQGTELPPHP